MADPGEDSSALHKRTRRGKRNRGAQPGGTDPAADESKHADDDGDAPPPTAVKATKPTHHHQQQAASVATSQQQQQQQQEYNKHRKGHFAGPPPKRQQDHDEEEEEAPERDFQDDDEEQEEEASPRRQQQHRREHDTVPSSSSPAAADGQPQQHGGSKAFKLLKLEGDYRDDYTALELNPFIVASLRDEFKFEKLTEIQGRCIPAALKGHDLLAEAKTGAGKTLAFLIPIVELLSRAGFGPKNGTGSIIIGPTRELCQQIEGVLLRLLKRFNGSITFLCCIGGINRKTEGYKLGSGQQIVVSTPGRLLDHLKLTTAWHTKNLLTLCVDEADRVLDNGFEEDVREIVSLLPKRRQTFLFSATQTTRLEQLARISFNKPPAFVSIKHKGDAATVETLEQGYVMCPSEHRFLLLYHFIKRHLKEKVIVFFSSRNSVSFHAELLNYIDVPCAAFHGKQKQHQRSATYMQFCNAKSGVLLTTDVSARGLDIPKVDWIVQFDPPDDPVKYIHRVGRTARAGNCGNALMFLLPSEKLFLKYLHVDARIAVNEYEFDLSKLNKGLQEQLESLVQSNYYLRQSAQAAYEGYLLAYSASQLKNVFQIQELDLAKVARGFGLREPPPVKMDLSESAARLNKKARKEYRATQEAGARGGTGQQRAQLESAKREQRHHHQPGGAGGGPHHQQSSQRQWSR